MQPTHPKICTSSYACGNASICIYHIFISNPSFLLLQGSGSTPGSKERLCGAFLPLPPLPIPPKCLKSSFKLHFQLPRGLVLLLLLLEVEGLEPRTGEWSQTTAKKTGRKTGFSNSNPKLDSPSHQGRCGVAPVFLCPHHIPCLTVRVGREEIKQQHGGVSFLKTERE